MSKTGCPQTYTHITMAPCHKAFTFVDRLKCNTTPIIVKMLINFACGNHDRRVWQWWIGPSHKKYDGREWKWTSIRRVYTFMTARPLVSHLFTNNNMDYCLEVYCLATFVESIICRPKRERERKRESNLSPLNWPSSPLMRAFWILTQNVDDTQI